MKIDLFQLERNQSLYENEVEYNLTESGVHSCTVRELLDQDDIKQLLDKSLGYGHTEGSPRLREAVSKWYTGASRDNVLITHGASEANLVAMLSILSAGDELIFVLPNFMQVWGIARAMGVVVKTVSLREESGWQLDLEEVKSLVTARTKAIAFSNPNNPTGQVFSQETMAGLVAIAQSAGLYLFSDEIYRGAELSGKETLTFYGMYEKVIVVSSTAKSLAQPGLRIGWLVGPVSIIQEAMQRQDYTTIGTSVLSQCVAEKILQPAIRQKLLERSHSILRQNLATIDQWIKHYPLMSYQRPQAGGMVFINYGLEMTSSELSEQLRKEQSVFVVAGEWFGLDRYIRIGIGSPPGYLDAALQRFDKFLAPAL